MKNKYLYILRGVPGCGKSTLAESITDNICCADDYFMDEDGNYNYNPTLISKAHDYSVKTCKTYMIEGRDKIVVANTNTKIKDTKRYTNLAKTYGYTVFYMVVENRHGGTDVHGVPEDTKERMENNIINSLKLR